MQTRRATGRAAGGGGGGDAGGGGGGDAGHTFEYAEGHPGCPILMGRKKKSSSIHYLHHERRF